MVEQKHYATATGRGVVADYIAKNTFILGDGERDRLAKAIREALEQAYEQGKGQANG